jgi:DNA-binding NtrC family response regulator
MPSVVRDLVPEPILFGRSNTMQELKHKLSRFCSASVPVLLQGEVGVGKDELARFIHQRWFASRGHYARLSCASVNMGWAAFALNATLKGSTPPGRNSGTPVRPVTLFLDEVNELPSKLQRLLSILLIEQKEAHDAGHGPVCIVSSSTRDLRREVKEGRFRRDLFQQLAIGVLQVPPLRDRVQDLPEICEYLRCRCSLQAGADDKPFPPDLLERMLLHRWPGNLNELEAFIRRFVALGPENSGFLQSLDTNVGETGKWVM